MLCQRRRKRFDGDKSKKPAELQNSVGLVFYAISALPEVSLRYLCIVRSKHPVFPFTPAQNELKSSPHISARQI